MSTTESTPSKALHRQKARLQVRSDALTEGLENNLKYLQHNQGTIIGKTIANVAAPKTQPERCLTYCPPKQTIPWISQRKQSPPATDVSIYTY
jgi:hypothetical protein